MFNLMGRSRPCQHPETVTTSNYGLLRRVCRVCGMVHIEGLPGVDVRQPDKKQQLENEHQPVAATR